MDNKKTLWPIGIAIFMLIMVFMIILTVYLSIKAKPDDDNAYFSTRQIVDKDINNIIANQNDLESRFDFYAIDSSLQSYKLDRRVIKGQSKPISINLGSPFVLSIRIVGDNKYVNDAEVRAIITRFATSAFDKDLGNLYFDGSIFKSEDIFLEKGPWKALIKVSIDGKDAFFEQFIQVKE